jgi:hypothetical protein
VIDAARHRFHIVGNPQRRFPVKRIGPVLLACAMIAAPAAAHHGWGSYDANTVLKIQAPIIEAKYESPHGELLLAHQGKQWTITLAPPFRMQNRGLPKDALVKGKVVIVEGYPSRANATEMRAERITVDGKVTELR